MLKIDESTIHRSFLACVVLMEAMFSYFNLKPDELQPGYYDFRTQTFSITEATHTEKAWVKISPIGMGLRFSRIHPGSIPDRKKYHRKKFNVIS